MSTWTGAAPRGFGADNRPAVPMHLAVTLLVGVDFYVDLLKYVGRLGRVFISVLHGSPSGQDALSFVEFFIRVG